MLVLKRPGTGLHPKHFNKLIGKLIKTTIKIKKFHYDNHQ